MGSLCKTLALNVLPAAFAADISDKLGLLPLLRRLRLSERTRKET